MHSGLICEASRLHQHLLQSCADDAVSPDLVWYTYFGSASVHKWWISLLWVFDLILVLGGVPWEPRTTRKQIGYFPVQRLWFVLTEFDADFFYSVGGLLEGYSQTSSSPATPVHKDGLQARFEIQFSHSRESWICAVDSSMNLSWKAFSPESLPKCSTTQVVFFWCRRQNSAPEESSPSLYWNQTLPVPWPTRLQDAWSPPPGTKAQLIVGNPAFSSRRPQPQTWRRWFSF